MTSHSGDLGVLARAKGSNDSRATGAAASVPPPATNWKTRVLLPAALLASTAGLLAYSARDALRPATPVRVVPVVGRTVAGSSGGPDGADAGGSGGTVQAPGWVEPDPFPVSVSALTDGVVKEVLVVEGQSVKAGDVVVRLIDDDAKLALARAEAELAGREGELDAAKAALEAAQREWDNPVERKRAVDSAEALVAQAKAELERLPVEVEAERARAEELADALRRTEANVARQAVGEGELVQARLRHKAQQALLALTQARRPVLEATVRQHQADLAAAREAASLRIAERKALAEAKAALRRAEAAVRQAAVARDEAALRLERTAVRSPADGVVMSRHVEPGAKLMLSGTEMKSAHALRLYDPGRLQVRVDVPLADASRVGVGQGAKVVVGVLPDRTFDGVVTRLVHEADIQRNTVQVKVAIKDPSPQLKPEMLARVRFLPATRSTTTAPAGGAAPASQRVFAPERMLRRDGSSAHVWVVDKGRGIATLRTVTPGGARYDDWVVITSGLQPGDLLIAGDTSALSEGTRVRILGEEGDAVAATARPAGGSHGPH